jgi:hypothetical protein
LTPEDEEILDALEQVDVDQPDAEKGFTVILVKNQVYKDSNILLEIQGQQVLQEHRSDSQR